MLGQAAFERVARPHIRATTRSRTSARGHAAWLEINETTAPPPEVAYHVLPNRTRLAGSRAATVL